MFRIFPLLSPLSLPEISKNSFSLFTLQMIWLNSQFYGDLEYVILLFFNTLSCYFIMKPVTYLKSVRNFEFIDVLRNWDKENEFFYNPTGE
jgi:hypothetical protein